MIAAPVVVATVAAVGCSAHRDAVWTAEPIVSPDGRLVAAQGEYLYDRGLFSEGVRLAEVRYAAVMSGEPVAAVVIDGDWREGQDAADDVRLGWSSSDVLEIVVPNLTEWYSKPPKPDGVTIRVVYREDDPVARRRWLRKRSGSTER